MLLELDRPERSLQSILLVCVGMFIPEEPVFPTELVAHSHRVSVTLLLSYLIQQGFVVDGITLFCSTCPSVEGKKSCRDYLNFSFAF